MSEIDFDELDKAVNSIMSQPGAAADSTTRSSTAQANSEVEAVDDGATASQGEASNPPTARNAPMQSDSPTPVAQRRGQFMDMIHPSAKMREANSQAPRPRVSRQGNPVAPRSSAISDYDQVENNTERSITEPDSSKTSLTDYSTSQSADKTASENIEPLQTPFLADAKVDKRPLGAPNKLIASDDEQESGKQNQSAAGNDISTQMSELNTSSSTSETKSAANQRPVASVEDDPPATPLPAELNNDIMKIESAGATESGFADVEPASQAPKPKPSSLETGQSSIPPQYKSAVPKVPKAEDDTPTASMYDQGFGPLKAPVKKKSSWPIVIGAIVLIMLGVIGSVALFLLNHS